MARKNVSVITVVHNKPCWHICGWCFPKLVNSDNCINLHLLINIYIYRCVFSSILWNMDVGSGVEVGLLTNLQQYLIQFSYPIIQKEWNIVQAYYSVKYALLDLKSVANFSLISGHFERIKIIGFVNSDSDQEHILEKHGVHQKHTKDPEDLLVKRVVL